MESTLLYKHLGRNEFDYSLLSGALREMGYSAPTKKIHDLMKAGVLSGVKKGLYVFTPDFARGPLSKETLANLIYGPSCLSLEYALSYHGLIPERVETMTSVTPKRDKLFQTPLGTFSYRYLAGEKYREGIELIWLDPHHSVFMACPEKALLDYLTLNKIRSIKTLSEAKVFLEDDLRIGTENWKKFNPITFHKLNRIYKSRSGDSMAELFEGIKR